MTIIRTIPMNCVAFAAAALALGVLATPVSAAFKVEYSVGSTSATITDNGADDLDPTVGSIFISKTVDQVTFAIVANSNRTTPEVAAQVQDATVNIQNGAGFSQTARITITDTGFNFPGVAGNTATLESRLGISSLGGAGTQLSGTFQSFADNANTEFGKTIGTTPQTLSFPLPPSEQMRTEHFTRSADYSLTNEFLLTLPANQQNGASFTGTTRVFLTPVPGNIILLASALPALGLCGWVLRRRKPIAA